MTRPVPALVVLLLLAACSTDPAPHKAAEPGRAPVPTVAPAGVVVDLGNEAEGVVVDPVTHVAAVGVRAPFGLALVDTRTGRLLRTVPLPGHVRHLAARGSTVLVPVEDAGRLLEVALPSGSVTADVPTPGYPHGVSAVGSDGALVGNERAARITLVRRGSVVTTQSGFPQPGGSASSADAVYVVDVMTYRLTRLSPALEVGPSVEAGAGPTHAVADVRGNVVVVDTRGDAMSSYSQALKALHRVELPGKPYGVAYDAVRDEVWVTLTSRNEVVRLAGTDLHETGRWPTVQQPNTVGVDTATGAVVIAGRTNGDLQLLTP